MNCDNFQNAAEKAEEMMNIKYGNTWFITRKSEIEGDLIEIKPEYVNEYDKYYEKFLWN